MDRQRLSREIAYLRDRLVREEGKRHNAKENDHRFHALSRNSTLIKSVMVHHMRGGTVDGMDFKKLENLRDKYEETLTRAAEKAEQEEEPDFFSPQSLAAGKEAGVEEEEEEWEMLDRLQQEATRKQREAAMPKTQVQSAPGGAAGAPPRPISAPNSKQAMVAALMADKTISPADRQRQIAAIMGRAE